MKIVVTKKFSGGNETLSTNYYEALTNKKLTIVSRKVEKKLPVRKWFRVVGYRLAMFNEDILTLIPQSVNKEGITFIIESKINVTASGDVVIVKNAKKGDVYILGVGKSITFTTQDENPNEEYNISIKGEK